MPTLPKGVIQKINAILQPYDIKLGNGLGPNDLNMTDIPKDNYWTEVFHARAKYEAKDFDENYLCFVCGKKYDHPDELTACINQHMIDFNAGIPIKREPEHVERLLKNIHPSDKEEMRKKLLGED